MTATYTIPTIPQNGGTFDLDGSNSAWVRLTDTKFLLVYQQQSPAITYAQIMTVNLSGAPTMGTAHQINQHTITKSTPVLGYIQTGGLATDHKVIVAQRTVDVRNQSPSLDYDYVITLLEIDEITDNIVSGNFINQSNLNEIDSNSLQFESNQTDKFYSICSRRKSAFIVEWSVNDINSISFERFVPNSGGFDEIYHRGEIAVHKASDNTIHVHFCQPDDGTSTTRYSQQVVIDASGVDSTTSRVNNFGTNAARGLPVFGWSGTNRLDYVTNNRWKSQTSTSYTRNVPIGYPLSSSRVPRELIEVDTDTFLQLSMPVIQFSTAGSISSSTWTTSSPMEVHVFHIDSGSNNTSVDGLNNPVSIGDVYGMTAMSTNTNDSDRSCMWRNTCKMVYQMSPTQVLIMGLYDDNGTNKIGYKVLSI